MMFIPTSATTLWKLLSIVLEMTPEINSYNDTNLYQIVGQQVTRGGKIMYNYGMNGRLDLGVECAKVGLV